MSGWEEEKREACLDLALNKGIICSPHILLAGSRVLKPQQCMICLLSCSRLSHRFEGLFYVLKTEKKWRTGSVL